MRYRGSVYEVGENPAPRRKPGGCFSFFFFPFSELGNLMGIGGRDIRSGKARGKVKGILFVSFSPNFWEMGESMGYRGSGYKVGRSPVSRGKIGGFFFFLFLPFF